MRTYLLIFALTVSACGGGFSSGDPSLGGAAGDDGGANTASAGSGGTPYVAGTGGSAVSASGAGGGPAGSGGDVGGMAGAAQGGAASAAGTGSAGAGGAPHDPAQCIAGLPSGTFTWSREKPWIDLDNGTFACAQSPCWSADISWDTDSMVFDEARGKLSVDVVVHAPDGFHLSINGVECVMSVQSDFTQTIVFTVEQVSNGYQVMSMLDNNMLKYGSYSHYVGLGTCPSGYPGTYSQITGDLDIAWLIWLQQPTGIIIFPCVR